MAFDPVGTWHLPDYPWPLPESIKRRLGTHSLGRQRVIVEEGHLLLVLHRPPHSQARSREGTLVLRLPSGVWMADGHDHGLLALTRLFQEYETTLAELLGLYRQATKALEYLAILHRLAPMARAARNLRETMQTAREQMREDRELLGFRDQADDLSRTLDLFLEDCEFSLEAVQAAKAEEEVNETKGARDTQRKLNLLAAMTFPMMAIGAVFSMNFASGLNPESVLMFWLMLAMGMVVGVLLTRWAR